MNMVWHDDKANALGMDRLKLMIEDAEHNAFGPVEIEQLTILKDGKRDEMGVALPSDSTGLAMSFASRT